jgi:hypothetical protein
VPERKAGEWSLLSSPARRLRRRLGARRILLAGHDTDPPPFLLDPEFRGLVYRSTALADPRACELVSAGDARVVVLVPDEADPAADDRCLSSALAVGEALARAAATDAERRDPAPRDLYLQVRAAANVPAALRIHRRLHEAGVGCQVLEMERLVGLFLAQHVIDPDLDPIFEEILATSGQALWVRMAHEDDPQRETWPRAIPAVVPHEASWRGHRIIPLGLLTAPPAAGAQPPRGASTLRRTHGCGTQLGLGPGTERPAPERVAGVVALGPSEHPVRAWARDLAAGRLDDAGEPEPSPAATALAGSLALAAHETRRVLLVGDHPALAALVVELVRFLPGLEIRLLPEEPRSGVGELEAGLETALRRFDSAARVVPDGDALALHLGESRSGRLGLHPAAGGSSAATYVLEPSDIAAFDRVVFLSDPGTPGSDDRTTVRFLRTLDAACAGEGCRFVVQVESESRAALLTDAARNQGRNGSRFALSVLAAEQVRAHFLAHAMFTPGIVPVLDELLAERGQEFVRLEPRGGSAPPHERISFGDLLVALGRRGPGAITALGWVFQRDDVRIARLNPPPDEQPYADEIRSIFAVADTRALKGG